MAAPTEPTTQLWLSSGNGPISRTILSTPLRDAQPSEIPLIDVSGIFSPSLPARTAVAQQIRHAATTNGFFYMTNHGIPAPITSAAHSAGLSFFRRPAEAKEPVRTTHSQHHKYKVGWKPAATLRINPFESADMRESFSWRYDPRYDPAVGRMENVPAEVARYMKVDEDGFPWSKTGDLPEFEEAVVKCWQAVLGLGRALVRSMALSLGLEEDAFDAKFTHPDAAVALNYYPSLEGGEGEGKDVSIGSHTDFQLFTILWQDEVGGLQVLDREGQWLRAKPIPGAFVVNFADYMQRITNDRYLSTVHRVQNATGKERLSMAFFFGFNLNESCGVLDTCVKPGEEKKYDEISCQEWTQRRLKAMHTTKAE
ncbi:2OG-Fe(II) oxygenase [Lasiosphaeria hispida]|uniref:2OG-Fe(II) oxygenase n=1 Tax=Lasiosphaeria hispida TaxID=260671 RepID=A0AAJ0HB50_9PEZI|nr:2OG-Fe(II) oxygenase [Lasiosphaeria hispida]